MKKLFYLISLTATLAFAASCAKEADIDPVKGSDKVDVSYVIGLDKGIATKALGEGLSADELLVKVFDKDGTLLTLEPSKVEKDPNNALQFIVTMRLVRNVEYKVLFWAQKEGAYTSAFSTDGKTVTISSSTANDDTKDAFYAIETVKIENDEVLNKSVNLYRPFAMIRLGSIAADYTGAGLTDIKSKVTVEKAYSAINLVEGTFTPETPTADSKVVFAETSSLVADTYKFDVGTTTGIYNVATVYLLAGDTQSLVDVTYDFTAKLGSSDYTLKRIIKNVPVKKNYQTNLYGSVFTTEGTVTVVLQPGIGSGDNNQTIDIPFEAPTVQPAEGNTSYPTPDATTGNINVDVAGTLNFAIQTNSPGTVTYTSSDTDVADFLDPTNNPGLLTAKAAGETDVTVSIGQYTKALTPDTDTNFASYSVTYHVVVSAAAPVTYNINKADVTNGSLAVKIGENEVTKAAEGATITVEATPASGYQLATLIYTPEGESPVDIKAAGSFTMPAKDVEVAATFEEIPATNYTVTIDDNITNGTVSASHSTAAAGATVTLTIAPDSGYELDDITVLDGDAQEVIVSGNSFTMPASDVEVSATFKKIKYTVTIASMTGGSVVADATSVEWGEEVTLTVTPDSGMQLKSGTLAVSGGVSNLTDMEDGQGHWMFTMPQSVVTVSAEFETVAPSTKTIAEVKTLIDAVASTGTSGVDFTGGEVTLNAFTVTAVSGKSAFLEDATGGLTIYLNNHGLVAGKRYTGLKASAGVKYNGITYQVTAIDASSAEIETVADLPLTNVTIADINNNFATYEGKRVKLTDVTLPNAVSSSSKTTFVLSQSTNTINAYGQPSSNIKAGSTADIIGNVTNYSNSNQITITEADGIDVTYEPLDPAVINNMPSTKSLKAGDSFDFSTVVTASIAETSVIVYTMELGDGSTSSDFTWSGTTITVPAGATVGHTATVKANIPASAGNYIAATEKSCVITIIEDTGSGETHNDIEFSLAFNEESTWPDNFPTASGTKTGTYKFKDSVDDEYDFGFSCNTGFYNSSNNYLIIGKSGTTEQTTSYIALPAITNYKLVAVKVTATSGTSTNVAAYVSTGYGEGKVSDADWTFAQSGSSSFTISGTTAGVGYRLYIVNAKGSSSYNAQIEKIELTYTYDN